MPYHPTLQRPVPTYRLLAAFTCGVFPFPYCLPAYIASPVFVLPAITPTCHYWMVTTMHLFNLIHLYPPTPPFCQVSTGSVPAIPPPPHTAGIPTFYLCLPPPLPGLPCCLLFYLAIPTHVWVLPFLFWVVPYVLQPTVTCCLDLPKFYVLLTLPHPSHAIPILYLHSSDILPLLSLPSACLTLCITFLLLPHMSFPTILLPCCDSPPQILPSVPTTTFGPSGWRLSSPYSPASLYLPSFTPDLLRALPPPAFALCFLAALPWTG